MRFLKFVAALAAAALLHFAGARLVPNFSLAVDLFLLVVALEARHGSPLAGMFAGLAAGLLADGLSGGPYGMYGFANTAVGFGIAIVLLYFFVRDGVAWSTRVIRLIPMEPVRRSGLIAHLAQVTRAVVFGSGATALLQGIAVGIGFAIAGLPTYVVFGVLTALLSLLPMGGAALVWVPGMLYLAAAGRWGMAVFLLIWGVGVSFGDNVVRPLLVSRHAEVSTLTVFIGVLGGAAAFGAIGLIVGPLVLTLAKALLDYMDEMLVRPA